MKKRILLIYPPSPVLNREDRCQQPTKELIVIPPLPPADLMYLAAVAEKQGFEAKIADYSQSGDYEADLREFKPDYLVVNIATPTLEHDLDAVKKAKEICPNITTVAKGAAFLTLGEKIVSEHNELDFGILGEAEDTLKDILDNKPKNNILGIYYKENDEVKFTGKRPFIEDLDSLPFPARHLVNNNIYRRPDNNKVQATIKVSRGCPFHCFFCLATPVSGAKVRRRSPENIVAEIRECVEKYNIEPPALFIEPGRSIISTAGVTLYTAGSSKQVPKGKKYFAVDGGMADNPRPSMYQAEYYAEIANKPDFELRQDVTIAGRFCESGDILIKNIKLPQLEEGDILCVYNTGAYNYSMASNYNRVQKPAMVLVNNSQSDIIIKRETLDDLIAHDEIPHRLRK